MMRLSLATIFILVAVLVPSCTPLTDDEKEVLANFDATIASLKTKLQDLKNNLNGKITNQNTAVRYFL